MTEWALAAALVLVVLAVVWLAYRLGARNQQAKQERAVRDAKDRMDAVPDSSKSDTVDRLSDGGF